MQSWNLKYYDSENKKYAKTPFAMYNTTELINQKSLSYLVGTLALSSSVSIQFSAQYSPSAGVCTIPAQYVNDPTGTAPILMLLGADSVQGSIWYTDWQVSEDPDTHKWQLVDPTGNADSIILLCCNSQGSPLYVKSDNTMTDDPDDPDIQNIAVLDLWWKVSDLLAQ